MTLRGARSTRRERSLRGLVLYAAVGILLLAMPGLAQISSSTGSIQGTATDPAGAVVAGAKVVAINTGTGVRTETLSGSNGSFAFPFLLPGIYRVEVESAGFQKAVLTDLLVQVTKTTVANARMVIGQVSTEIIVSEAAQTVDTATATTGDVISSQLIKAIPLPTRNFLDLAALQPGVGAVLGSPAALGRGTPQVFVAGQRGTNNSFVLNGVDANNLGNNNLGNVPVPNPDAVQEFRVNTSQYDASQGRASGGVINVVQKSGTRDIHGSAFWFYRSDALNANDFFFNRNGTEKPTLLQNQYGGTVGGPVPGLEETFWFFSYQRWGQKNGVSGSVSGLQPVLPSTRDAASLAAAFGLNPASIDPVAVAWLNQPGPFGGLLYPSASGALGTNQTFSISSPSIFNENQYNATFDRKLFRNNQLGVRFFYADPESLNPFGGGVSLGQGQSNPSINWHAAVSDIHTISSTLVNEFHAGFTLLKAKTKANEGTKLSNIGMTRFNSSFFDGTPAVFFSNGLLSGLGISTNNDQASQNLSYTFTDTVSWTRGKHTLRGGFEFRRYHINTFNNFASRGFLNFPDFQSFLTGTPDDVFVGTGVTDRGFRAYDISWFVQDDYRIFRRLTLNLGLRYDFLSPSTDIRNRIGNFDPSLLTSACLQTGGNCLRDGFISPAGLGGGFGTPGVSDSTLFDSDKNNFAPRIGLAYDVFGDGKLAVRGGYGIYFVRTSNQTLLQLITGAPFFQLFRASGTGIIGSQALANPYPILPTPDQFPVLPVFPQFSSLAASGAPNFVNPATGLPTPLLTVNPFERSLRSPYNQNWNLTVQYEFLKGWVAEAGYIGSRAIKLLHSRQINAAHLVDATNPGLGGLTNNSSANINSRTLVPGFSSTGLNAVTGSGNSWYNAFVFSVRHPFSKGLQIKADYTFSKSLDNNSGSFTQDLGNSGGNQLAFDLNKGLSNFDQKHRLIFTYLWEIPGPKQGLLGRVLGGWSMSGVTTLQSGFPFNVVSTTSGNLQGAGSAIGRANTSCNGGFTIGGNVSNAVDRFINTACFSAPATLAAGTVLTNVNANLAPGAGNFTIGPGTGVLFGALGRNALRGPFQQRFDMALTKTIALDPLYPYLGEKANLEFRTEFFKLFNTPIFNNPVSNVSSGSFGRITSTTDTTGRVIQFALKLNF